ncbi:MAG: T9SS type A sorting domain-containing protein [Crocinitomicaceae bacterium]|nr:T9SS type A sorting domain-containing protein [Crocinitomicaceae bacterium]
MKTMLFTLCLIASNYSIQAQTTIYQPYPLQNATWTIHTQYFDGSGLVQDWVTEDWGEDILINGQTYTEVIGDANIQGVRQDIPNEKIFYIDNQGVEHDASFDQSVVLGDTVLLTEAFRALNMSPAGVVGASWPGIDTVVVLAVDSILVGPSYRKRFSLDGVPFDNQYLYDISYICGVGCAGYVTFEAGFTLDCFYIEGALLLGSEFNPYCTTSIEELPKQSIAVYPNPTLGLFFIEYDHPSELNEINLLDLWGRRIAQFDVQATEKGFDISTLPSGTYIVEMLFSNEKVRTTLLK